jgi:hypothetical protein
VGTAHHFTVNQSNLPTPQQLATLVTPRSTTPSNLFQKISGFVKYFGYVFDFHGTISVAGIDSSGTQFNCESI